MEEFSHYRLDSFKKDLTAAFSVAFLAIPQSIAYSLLAGLPPSCGFFSAVFGTIFTSAFASSRHIISGPTTAISILIQTTLSQVLQGYPHADETFTLQVLMHIVLAVGLLQIGLGFLNISKLLQFVSRSVILGYFAGVMISIVATQLPYLFGVPSSSSGLTIGKLIDFFTHITQLQIGALIIGVLAFFLLYVFRKKEKLPDALLMLVLTGVAAYLLNFLPYKILEVPTLKGIGFAGIPAFGFSLGYFRFDLFSSVFLSSIAIALLSLLEVFSISQGFAAKSGQEVSSNREVFAIGSSNLLLSLFFGAMPASGSLSRSTINYQSHPKTRLAGILSGVLVALIIFFGWPMMQHVPLAALAALLIGMFPVLMHRGEIGLCFRATRGDAVVFLLTMGCCIFLRLDYAFFVGIFLALASFLRKAASLHLIEYSFNSAGRLVVSEGDIHRKVRIIGISGELFFAAVDLFEKALATVAKDPHAEVLILRLNRVYYVDASMCFAILRLHEFLRATKRHLLISGITEEVWRTLEKAGIIRKIGKDNLFLSEEINPQFSTWKAYQRANELLLS